MTITKLHLKLRLQEHISLQTCISYTNNSFFALACLSDLQRLEFEAVCVYIPEDQI